MVDPKDAEAYNELQSQMNQALGKGELAVYEQLKVKQDSLGFYRPFMTHSVTEAGKRVEFHCQLLTDFSTVEELALSFLKELDR